MSPSGSAEATKSLLPSYLRGASEEVVMRSSIGSGLLTLVLALGLSAAATPLRAEISADLAKKCRAMMVTAHPTQMFGTTGTAAVQRDYFRQCISRQGRMDNAEPSTTGQGGQGSRP